MKKVRIKIYKTIIENIRLKTFYSSPFRKSTTYLHRILTYITFQGEELAISDGKYLGKYKKKWSSTKKYETRV